MSHKPIRRPTVTHRQHVVRVEFESTNEILSSDLFVVLYWLKLATYLNSMLICAKNSFALTLQLATSLNPASQTWGSCHWRTLTRPGSWPPVSKGKPSVVLKNSFSWKVGTKSQKLDIMQKKTLLFLLQIVTCSQSFRSIGFELSDLSRFLRTFV